MKFAPSVTFVATTVPPSNVTVAVLLPFLIDGVNSVPPESANVPGVLLFPRMIPLSNSATASPLMLNKPSPALLPDQLCPT